MNQLLKRHAAAKANWGRLGDEVFDTVIDLYASAYDSADKLLKAAFGSSLRNTNNDASVHFFTHACIFLCARAYSGVWRVFGL